MQVREAAFLRLASIIITANYDIFSTMSVSSVSRSSGSDSTLVLNVYCYAEGAAKAAGKITVNRGEWEFFDVSAGNGYITLDGVKKGQNTV